MSSNDIEWLMAAKNVPRAIARQAFADAEKALKARRPKGFAAIEQASKGELPSARDEALRLLDEPARQPAAVEALARVKKESRRPIAACRAALAEANYDAETALELLRARPAPTKATTKPTKTNAPRVNHSLDRMSGPDAAGVVLLARRARPHSKEEMRLHAQDRIYDQDRCIAFVADDGWRRRERVGQFDDLWVSDEGRLTVVAGNAMHTLAQATVKDATKFVVDGATPRRLAGCEGVGEVAFDPFPSKKHVIWWRAWGQDWTELPQPPSISSPLHVEVTKDRIWLCGWGQTVASYDGERWKEASLDHGAAEPGRRVFTFTCFAVSPDRRVLASRDGQLYAGDGDELRAIHDAGYQEVSSIAYFAGSFWIGHTRLGICRWDGERLIPVAKAAKLRGLDDKTTIHLSARRTLLALSPAELLESTDGATFRTVVTSREIGEVVGSDDVYWNGVTSRGAR